MTEPFKPMPLHQGELDQNLFDQLFDDLAHHTEIIDIRLKSAPGAHADPGRVTLALAHRSLTERSARGAQITYRWDGACWTDTLLATTSGWRIVRVKSE